MLNSYMKVSFQIKFSIELMPSFIHYVVISGIIILIANTENITKILIRKFLFF